MARHPSLLLALITLAIGLLHFTTGCGPLSTPSQPPASATNPPPVASPVIAPVSAPTVFSPTATPNVVPAWAGQRQDEPFDVRAYLASRADSPDNAAPHYLLALAPICSYVSGTEPTPLEQQIIELAKIDNIANGEVTAEQINDVLSRARAVIRQVDFAQTKPKCVFVTSLALDADLSHVYAARMVSRLTLLELEQARRANDVDQAMVAVRRSLRISRDLQPRAYLICQLVSIVIDSTTLTAIERITLNQPNLTTVQIDEILSILESHQRQSLNRLEEGLKMDYIASRNALDKLRVGEWTLDDVAAFVTPRYAEGSAQGTPSASIANYEAEYAALNELFQQAIRAAHPPNDGKLFQAEYQRALSQHHAKLAEFKELAAATPVDDRPKLLDRAPACLQFIFAPAVEAFIEESRQPATQLAGVQLLLALRRYEIAHGRLPETLEQAAAECMLKTVPLDPYDGQPMRYAVVAGQPTIYSVGRDRNDHGGKIDEEFGKRPGDYLFIVRATKP